ncbi:MAG TPA: hypothetical protein VFT49_04085 [Candidatus Saccharimonadales bacterium]|nr:hypothetical protein [Candidatus Saccharimonadales bacterium]
MGSPETSGSEQSPAPPTEEELEAIQRVVDLGHFNRVQAEIDVLGAARAAAWRLGVPADEAPSETTTEPSRSLSSRQEQKEFNMRVAKLANEAMQSEQGTEEYLRGLPPSSERDKLLEAFEDPKAA